MLCGITQNWTPRDVFVEMRIISLLSLNPSPVALSDSSLGPQAESLEGSAKGGSRGVPGATASAAMIPHRWGGARLEPDCA